MTDRDDIDEHELAAIRASALRRNACSVIRTQVRLLLADGWTRQSIEASVREALDDGVRDCLLRRGDRA